MKLDVHGQRAGQTGTHDSETASPTGERAAWPTRCLEPVQFLCSDFERRALSEAASGAGLTISGFLLAAAQPGLASLARVSHRQHRPSVDCHASPCALEADSPRRSICFARPSLLRRLGVGRIGRPSGRHSTTARKRWDTSTTSRLCSTCGCCERAGRRHAPQDTTTAVAHGRTSPGHQVRIAHASTFRQQGTAGTAAEHDPRSLTPWPERCREAPGPDPRCSAGAR